MTIRKLQTVQNVAACAVLSALWFIQITSLLHELHLLQVTFQVEFKLLDTVFKVLDQVTCSSA